MTWYLVKQRGNFTLPSEVS